MRRAAASGPAGIAVLALTAAGAVLLLAAEAAPLYEVEVVEASCEELAVPEVVDQCLTRGAEQHGLGLALLAVLALAMGLGAALGRSRPAALAVGAIGLVVLVLTLAIDLPAARSAGEIGQSFLEARGVPRVGLWLEGAGGAALVAAGVVGYLAARARRS